MDPYVLEDMDPHGNFTDLLNSQVPNSQLSAFFNTPTLASQIPDAPEVGETRKERRKWSPLEDIVLCSSWLNTSKDAVVSNEQKHDAFWKRVAAYFNASPKLAEVQDRETIHCKNRWQRINDSVSKFVGCYATASRQKSSGQNEDDVLRVAFDLYFQDHKVKFTLQHCWIELRNDQKWCASSSAKGEQSSKRMNVDQCTDSSNGEELRPVGVKAAKAAKKKVVSRKTGSVDSESSVKVFDHMWSIKEKDFAAKERMCKTSLLERLVAKKDPLSDEEKALKSKLISDLLGIWHAFFGPPGTLNDINVLDRSPVFDDILNGRAPKVSYIVNGHEYRLAYYLTDGIYPKWATFIQSITLPQDPKASLFATSQESVRKDVERAFGVLQARFAIVKNPALFWDKAKIAMVMRASIILHNMIVEDERDGYTHFNLSEFFQEDGNGNAHVDYTYSTDIPTNLANVMANRNQIRDRLKHEQLKADLVEHIWQKFGSN